MKLVQEEERKNLAKKAWKIENIIGNKTVLWSRAVSGKEK